LITDTSISNRNSEEKNRNSISSNKKLNKLNNKINDKKKSVLPPIPSNNKIKLINKKNLVNEIKINISNSNIKEGNENEVFCNNKDNLTNKFKNNQKLNSQNEKTNKNDFSFHNTNFNNAISNPLRDNHGINTKNIFKTYENSSENTSENKKNSKSPNSNTSTQDKHKEELNQTPQNNETIDNTVYDLEKEFNLVLLIKHLINQSKKDYENYSNNRKISSPEKNHISPNTIIDSSNKKIYYHYKNIQFIQNICNSVIDYKVNVFKIQKKKNINKNFLVIEFSLRKMNKEYNQNYKNFLYLDLSDLEEKKNLENFLNCTIEDLDNIWPILNYLLINYLSKNIHLFHLYSSKFLLNLQKKINNNNLIENNLYEKKKILDSISENEEGLLLEKFLFVDNQKLNLFNFLYEYIIYHFNQIKERIDDVEENTILINDINNKANKNNMNKDELLLDSQDIKSIEKKNEKNAKYSNIKVIKKKDFLPRNEISEKLLKINKERNLHNEMLNKKSEENYKIYLQSQTLFRKTFKFMELIIRSNTNKNCFLKERNFNDVFNKNFDKKILLNNLTSIILDEFSGIDNYTNALLSKDTDKYSKIINNGIIPYKFFKSKIFNFLY